MDDDDIWNLILGNNANDATATSFANGFAQGGVGPGSPPPTPDATKGLDLAAGPVFRFRWYRHGGHIGADTADRSAPKLAAFTSIG